MPYQSLTRGVGSALRLTEIVQILLRHGFADLVHRLRLADWIPARLRRRFQTEAAAVGAPETLGARLRAALSELGPTFVKLGQILSTRPDILGFALSNELTKLQDQVTPLPFDRMRPVIEESLHNSLDELFAEFDPEPVASASLSQVYRARLKTGQAVAVKVQRPSIKQRIESDLRLLRAFAEWAGEHVEEMAWMNPVGVVEEFERSLMREIDFNIELRLIERFRQNFRNDDKVFIPRVYREFSARRVLTMDWIEGVRVDALDEYPARGSNPKTVAIKGCEALCEQVFRHHLFHADPHPGNIFLTRDNQIAFLDYGMVGHLEHDDVMAMADLLRAVFEENAEAAVRTLAQFTAPNEFIDQLEPLEHEIAEYIAFEAQTVIGGGNVGRALEVVVSILRRHELQLAPRFSLLIKALVTIESTGHALDPQMDMTPVIRPYVERILLERYSPRRILGNAQDDFRAVARLLRDLPDELRGLARMLRRGHIRIQLHHQRLDNLATIIDRASNRITFGLIAGAIIVGSSLLITAEQGTWTLGLAGYIIAGVLGIGLLISILRSRNF